MCAYGCTRMYALESPLMALRPICSPVVPRPTCTAAIPARTTTCPATTTPYAPSIPARVAVFLSCRAVLIGGVSGRAGMSGGFMASWLFCLMM